MEIVLFVAALLVAWAIFTWLVKVVKASVKTAFGIAIVVVILQIVFGIGPQQLWDQVMNLLQPILNLFSGA